MSSGVKLGECALEGRGMTRRIVMVIQPSAYTAQSIAPKVPKAVPEVTTIAHGVFMNGTARPVRRIRRNLIGLLVLPFVFCLSSSGVFAQPECTVSTITENVEYPPDWCGEISISGPATVNPGTNWVGTIEPAAPDVTCSVSSNSGCTMPCSVNEAGSQVTAQIGPNNCGSFTVTITKAASGPCPESSASTQVRINNTGQGGEWILVGSCSHGYCGPCDFTRAIPFECTQGQYKYNGQYWCCRTEIDGYCGSACSPNDCPANDCYPVPCHPGSGKCASLHCKCDDNYYYWYNKREWQCTTCE